MYTSNPPTTRYINSSIRISESEDDPLSARGDIKDDDSSAEEDAIEAIVCGPEPPAKRKKWIETRLEKPYTPLPEKCCRRDCRTQFSDELCSNMRRDVWGDRSLDSNGRRARIQTYWTFVFSWGRPEERQKACLNFILNVFDVVKGYLYYKASADSRVQQSDKLVSILLWFDRFKDICDPIPNEDNQWQVYAPSKRYVYDMYTGDREQFPGVWPSVSKSYFLRVWRRYKKEFRLRKHLRFTKCRICVTTREAIRNGRLSASERASAKAALETHYDRIRTERAAAKGNFAFFCEH